MKTRTSRAALTALLVVVTLAGCAPSGPPRDPVVERLLSELDGGTDGRLSKDNPEAVLLAETLADAAFRGECGDQDYFLELSGDDGAQIYAFAATCAEYFDDDMTEPLRELARDLLGSQAPASIAE